MFSSFIGTAVHKYAEQCLKRYSDKYDLERRLTTTIEDRIISGTFDILLDKIIFDIKTCKTWKLVYDPEMVDWHEQQNIYAYLLYLDGIEVEHIYIQAIYLDWIASKALRDRNYPQQPDPVYELELWPFDETEDFLRGRVGLMKRYEEVPDELLPECTMKERWEDPLRFACYKSNTAKQAYRVKNTLEEAIEIMKTTKGFGAGSYIEVRHAERKRCEKYCEVSHLCNVHRQYKSAIENNTLTEIIPYEQV
jgi:hypothetical protein